MFDMGFDDRYDKNNPKRNNLADREIDKETILKERRETEKLYKEIAENSMKGARKKGDDIPLRNSLRDLRERDLFGWRAIKKQEELLKQNQLALNTSVMDSKKIKFNSGKNPKEPGFKMGFPKRNKIKQQELDRQLELERIAHLKQMELKELNAQATHKLHELEFHVLSSASQELKQGFIFAITRYNEPMQDCELPQAYRKLLVSHYSNFMDSKFLNEIIEESAQYCRLERIHEDKPYPELVRHLNNELTEKLVEIVNIIKNSDEFDDPTVKAFISRMDGEYQTYLTDLEKSYSQLDLYGNGNGFFAEDTLDNHSEQLTDAPNDKGAELIEESYTQKQNTSTNPIPNLEITEQSNCDVKDMVGVINTKDQEHISDSNRNIPMNSDNKSPDSFNIIESKPIKQLQLNVTNGSPFQKFQAQLLPNLNSLKDGMLVVDVETPDLKDRRILSIGIAFWDKQTGEVKQLFYQKTKPSDFGTVDKNAWTFANRNLDYDEIAAMPETDYSALKCNDPVTGEEIGLNELFLRYPATGFNVSKFDIPALQSAGILPEEYAAPFDLSDACKHLVKGRTRQISEQDTFRLLFNNGNYAEKHIAIDDAMDEARILGEVYKIANNPAVFDEIREKKTNLLQLMQSILNTPKQMQTEIRMHQIKALEGKPYVGVQTLATEKYMTDPLRAKLCEIWYAERCRQNADLPHVSEDPKQAEAEFNALLKDIKQFKVIYISEGLNDEEMKAISDELAKNDELAVVVQAPSNGSASPIESSEKKPRKGLDLYVADSTAEEDFEPVYIEHGDQHIFSMDGELFMDIMEDFEELTESISQCYEHLENVAVTVSPSKIGIKEHILFEAIFNQFSGISFFEPIIRSKTKYRLDNAVCFSDKNSDEKKYFADQFVNLLQHKSKFGKDEIDHIRNTFDTTILLKCDYTRSSDIGIIADKLVKYSPGFKGLDKLFIVLNDYDYEHPRIHSEIMHQILDSIALANEYDDANPEILEYLDELQYRVFVLNIPAWFSLFKSDKAPKLLKTLKTPSDFKNNKHYFDYLRFMIKKFHSEFESDSLLSQNKTQLILEDELIHALTQRNIEPNYVDTKAGKSLDFDLIFDVRDLFISSIKERLFQFVKPSLSTINKQLTPFGIQSAAQTQEEFESIYVSRETNTQWVHIPHAHLFTASKMLITDRIEAGLEPCTVCNPLKYVFAPTLDMINDSYRQYGVQHAAKNQQEFEEMYRDRESNTLWHRVHCNHLFIAMKTLVDDRIKAGVNPCTVCNPPYSNSKTTLDKVNALYNEYAIRHIASSQQQFSSMYADYKSDTQWLRFTCNHVFTASRNLIDKRIKAGLNPCTICNPLKVSPKPSLLKINEIYSQHGIEHVAKTQEQFDDMYKDNRTPTEWHKISCNHTFSVPKYLLDYRIQAGIEPCTVCKPFKPSPKPTLQMINSMYSEIGIQHAAQSQELFDLLYKDFRTDSKWRKLDCNHVFIAPKYLIDKRIKAGLNPCTICNPLNFSYFPSLEKINSMYKQYGIQHAAKNQNDFIAMYKDNRTYTYWRKIQCNHVFFASKYLIDGRIKKGVEPCTVCKPLKKLKEDLDGEGGI